MKRTFPLSIVVSGSLAVLALIGGMVRGASVAVDLSPQAVQGWNQQLMDYLNKKAANEQDRALQVGKIHGSVVAVQNDHKRLLGWYEVATHANYTATYGLPMNWSEPAISIAWNPHNKELNIIIARPQLLLVSVDTRTAWHEVWRKDWFRNRKDKYILIDDNIRALDGLATGDADRQLGEWAVQETTRAAVEDHVMDFLAHAVSAQVAQQMAGRIVVKYEGEY